MRQFAILLTIFLLTGFTKAGRIDDNEPKFKVEIAYKVLQNPVTTEYSIDNKKIILNNVRYDNNEADYQSLNKSTFKDFDRNKIITFLKKVNWSGIQPKLGTSTTDGQHYIVKVEIENRAYNFDIQNTYHPTFDSLFTICNESIPNKEKREKYYLPYNALRK